jgi:Velvet factor
MFFRTDVDCNFFILSVDLWDSMGTSEQNLVMHPTNTAAAALSGSSPNTPPNYQPYMGVNNGSYYPNDYPSYGPSANNPNYQQGYHSSGPYSSGSSSMHHAYGQSDDYGQSSQGGGQFTRNLIGSLTASAFRLKDDKDVLGIWFILQDLSVRTEGMFRLRFSFLNLGKYSLFPTISDNSPPQTGDHRRPGVSLNTGTSKVQTTAMSESFQVFSAKKFPGMIESTELSRKFASQGIRIPVRHSNEKGGKSDDEDD